MELNKDTQDELFAAIQAIRDFLPLAALIAEALDPEASPLIAGGEQLLSKLFELLVKLPAHGSVDEQLQMDTVALWRQSAK